MNWMRDSVWVMKILNYMGVMQTVFIALTSVQVNILTIYFTKKSSSMLLLFHTYKQCSIMIFSPLLICLLKLLTLLFALKWLCVYFCLFIEWEKIVFVCSSFFSFGYTCTKWPEININRVSIFRNLFNLALDLSLFLFTFENFLHTRLKAKFSKFQVQTYTVFAWNWGMHRNM